MKNIAVTGGGTGGHTSAAIAIIERLKEIFSDSSMTYIGSHNGLERNVCNLIDWIDYRTISTGKFRRSFDIRNISDFFRFIKGIFQSWKILGEKKYEFLLSTGGFVSLPVVIAAYFRKIPVVVHEQTSIPGLSNRIAFKLCNKILLSLDIDGITKKNSRTYIFGNPVRRLVSESFNKNSGLFKDNIVYKPVLFITGGANGSFIFNSFVFENIDWLKKNFEVILQSGTHQTNNEFIQKMKSENREFPDRIFDFVEPCELGKIYAAKPVLLARAGAGTLTDIINFRLSSVLVPLKRSAGNEQLYNARLLFKEGASLVIEEDDFKTDKVKQALLNAAINQGRFRKSLERFPVFKEEDVKIVFSEFLS
jgi:UDP-N-acetylglucosamine--N-acetylmuramyl-(pentapeptide) pyrophosphoryl-undecaprenol N-acetylglucosamine transferase